MTPSPRLVLEAHAARSRTALALMLHGRARSALERKSALAPVLLGLIMTVLILTGTGIAVRIGDLLASRG